VIVWNCGWEGCTSAPVERLTNRPTWSDLEDNDGELPMRSMSCSDKIMRWNVLGLQGSLLSQYLEPVYLSSITLGLSGLPLYLWHCPCTRNDCDSAFVTCGQYGKIGS